MRDPAADDGLDGRWTRPRAAVVGLLAGAAVGVCCALVVLALGRGIAGFVNAGLGFGGMTVYLRRISPPGGLGMRRAVTYGACFAVGLVLVAVPALISGAVS